MSQEEKNQAYYAGRTDAFNGSDHQELGAQSSHLQPDYDRGYRDATSEQRLDQDTDWD